MKNKYIGDVILFPRKQDGLPITFLPIDYVYMPPKDAVIIPVLEI